MAPIGPLDGRALGEEAGSPTSRADRQGRRAASAQLGTSSAAHAALDAVDLASLAGRGIEAWDRSSAKPILATIVGAGGLEHREVTEAPERARALVADTPARAISVLGRMAAWTAFRDGR
jgi:hypothetical protein